MKINPTLIGSECAGGIMNIHMARKYYKEGNRNKAIKCLKDAEQCFHFMLWHSGNNKTEQVGSN